MMTITYCAQQIRQYHPDLFLLSLFCPKERLRSVWAVVAVFLELRNIPFTVTEPHMGHIRVQWWRDSFQSMYAGHNWNHYASEDLTNTIKRHNISCALFEEICTRQDLCLENGLPKDGDSLKDYTQGMMVPLNKILLSILEEEEEKSTRETISNMYNFVDMLRIKKVRCSKNFQDKNKNAAWIKEALQAMQHIKKPHTSFLRAQKALIGIYAGQLKKVDYDLQHSSLDKPPAFKELRVWLGAL